MSNHSINRVHVAALSNAKQQQAHVAQAGQRLHAAQQAAVQYKGALFRTSLSSPKPGSMAREMMAKLKPRPKTRRLAKGSAHGARAESSESVIDGDDGGDGDGDGAQSRYRVEPDEDGREGRREGAGEDTGESADGRDGSSERDDDEDAPGGGDAEAPVKARSARLRRVGRVGAVATGGRGGGGPISAAASLRAQWAVSAMGRGGLQELRRELVDRLLHAARGSDPTDWRRDWIGNVAAAYAARFELAGPAGFAGTDGLPSVRDLFMERSKAIPEASLLPHRARETMFCLLWPVVHGLECPRTATQVLEMMARMAALRRVSDAARRGLRSGSKRSPEVTT